MTSQNKKEKAPSVTVRGTVIGEGLPKICIPLTDGDLEGLAASVKKIKDTSCDLVEWRADCFLSLSNRQAREAALRLLRRELGELPLLFTIRTKEEGGPLAIDTESYIQYNREAINSGCIDLVDVELSRGEAAFSSLVQSAHEGNDTPADTLRPVAVVGSRHDFEKTPPKEEIIARLCQMQSLGADIAKFAVMPRTKRDVLTLLDATLTMQEEHADTPIITMSMGSLGALSRLAGSAFGSAVTFGTAGAASAPGQLPASLLGQTLPLLL